MCFPPLRFLHTHNSSFGEEGTLILVSCTFAQATTFAALRNANTNKIGFELVQRLFFKPQCKMQSSAAVH